MLMLMQMADADDADADEEASAAVIQAATAQRGLERLFMSSSIGAEAAVAQ